MLAMCHFSWRRTKNFLQGKSRNKTVSVKERKMTVLEEICSRPKYQSPCQPKQLWECQTVNRRPRLRKCRRNTTTTIRTAPVTQPTPSTTPVKMCVCMKQKPDSGVHQNQNDMLHIQSEFNGRFSFLHKLFVIYPLASQKIIKNSCLCVGNLTGCHFKSYLIW